MRAHEIATSPLEEKWVWPHRRGGASDDVANGAKILPELITGSASQTPNAEMDITRVQALRAGRRLAEAKIIPNHITSGEATRTILRALRFAVTIEPTPTALEVEREFNQRYAPVIHLAEVTEAPWSGRKFMTLSQVHEAASRELLAATG